MRPDFLRIFGRAVAAPGLLALALLASPGCRSTAAVLLDIPESSPTEAREPVSSQGQARSAPLPAIPADTVRPPIESAPSPDSVLALLPRHASGGIDWSAAIRDSVVKPAGSLSGGPARGEAGFGYDFFYGEMETFFPHSAHTDWMTCGSCHPTVFRGPGSARTSMKEIGEGRSCGSCHGSVAFGVDACERCHTAVTLPEGRIVPELATDLVIPRDSTVGMVDQFPPSLFPHWVHRIRYRCSACHPQPFVAQAGANKITMAAIQDGKSCGTCHNDRTAFGALQCARCHAPPPDPVRPPVPAEGTGSE